MHLKAEAYPRTAPTRSTDWLRPYKPDSSRPPQLPDFERVVYAVEPSRPPKNSYKPPGSAGSFARFSKQYTTEAAWKDPGFLSRGRYTDGFEVMGDISRLRRKDQEQAVPFSVETSPDPWPVLVHEPSSLNTHKSLQTLKSISSDNPRLRIYKNSSKASFV